MKRIIHIAAVLLICVAFISCEREDVPSHPEQGTRKQIAFAVESEWPEITKTAIKATAGFKPGDVFRAYATLYQESDYTYSSIESGYVFGEEVTIVEAQDNHSEGIKWVSSIESNWQFAYYNFAAVFPQHCANSYTTSFNIENGILTYTSKLELNCNSSLSEQYDCMYAFNNIDNTDGLATLVEFGFNHVFSLLNINVTTSSPETISNITEVSIQGLRSSLRTPFTITQTEVVENGVTKSKTITNDIKAVLKNYTPSSTYEFKVSNFNTVSTNEIEAVKDYLVFPEDLSVAPITIKVDYIQNGVASSKSIQLSSGEWESGKSYTYKLELN